jgi:hypothetical protein
VRHLPASSPALSSGRPAIAALSILLIGPAAAQLPPAPLLLGDPGSSAERPVVGRRADGGFVSAWLGARGTVAVRRFLADGTPVGAPITVKADDGRPARQLRLAVNERGDFVLGWEQFDGSSQFVIEARSYDADGQPRGAVRAHDFGNATSIGSDVAIDADGDFTVVWRDTRSIRVPLVLIPYATANLSNSRVQARRFDAGGAPLGPTALVATSLTDPALITGVYEQLPPAIASAANGESLIAWSTRDGLGPSAVFARRLGVDGRPRDHAFRVDSRADGGAFGADVAMNETGSAVVTWLRPHVTGSNSSSGHDVLARRYDATGKAGPVIAAGDRVAIGSRASVDLNAAGEALIAWAATASDFCCFPPLVVAQRLDPQGVRIGDSLVLSTQYTEDADTGLAADGSAVVVWSARDPNLPMLYGSLLPPP